MAEYVAKRDRNRCPTHPGELLREDVIPAAVHDVRFRALQIQTRPSGQSGDRSC